MSDESQPDSGGMSAPRALNPAEISNSNLAAPPATPVAAAVGEASLGAPHAPAAPTIPPDVPYGTPGPRGVDPPPQPMTEAERAAWLQNHLNDLEVQMRKSVQELKKLHGGEQNPFPHIFVAIRDGLTHIVELARKLRP
jgi:hypothetical protein